MRTTCSNCFEPSPRGAGGLHIGRDVSTMAVRSPVARGVSGGGVADGGVADDCAVVRWRIASASPYTTCCSSPMFSLRPLMSCGSENDERRLGEGDKPMPSSSSCPPSSRPGSLIACIGSGENAHVQGKNQQQANQQQAIPSLTSLSCRTHRQIPTRPPLFFLLT